MNDELIAIHFISFLNASLVQLVEHFSLKDFVKGSIPLRSTSFFFKVKSSKGKDTSPLNEPGHGSNPCLTTNFGQIAQLEDEKSSRAPGAGVQEVRGSNPLLATILLKA